MQLDCTWGRLSVCCDWSFLMAAILSMRDCFSGSVVDAAAGQGERILSTERQLSILSFFDVLSSVFVS